MASRTVLVDDIDGTEPAESVAFNLGGIEYALDLKPAHSEELDHLVQRITPYLDAAVKAAEAMKPSIQAAANSLNAMGAAVGEGQERAKRHKSSGTRPDLPAPSEEIRAWARANGWGVSDKGKIPVKIVEAFIAADNGTKGNQPGGDGSAEMDPAWSGPSVDGEASTDPDPSVSNAPTQPADDAPVEEWRAYARSTAYDDNPEYPDLDELNRSQIRTLLGIEQPMAAGPEWGDVPPAGQQPVQPPTAPSVGIPLADSFPPPEPSPETPGQKAHRESMEQLAASAGTSTGLPSPDSAPNASQAAPLTPEQVEEQARQEIAAAQRAVTAVAEATESAESALQGAELRAEQTGPPPAAVLPFRTP